MNLFLGFVASENVYTNCLLAFPDECNRFRFKCSLLLYELFDFAPDFGVGHFMVHLMYLFCCQFFPKRLFIPLFDFYAAPYTKRNYCSHNRKL
ncbi:hypothetical protein AYI69_g6849 [Smittium culicis]|uniref:Uncharacterized protein n=1 Tax=Smittium culicis TaxID=133412 RepID=A0A1R1XWC9_9FUNG|nr:hypothetical protein AYI69_g6849 [Smittium culicis]